IVLFTRVALQIVELRVRRHDQAPGVRPHTTQFRPAHVGTGIESLTVRVIGSPPSAIVDERPETHTLDFGARRQIQECKTAWALRQWTAPGHESLCREEPRDRQE